MRKRHPNKEVEAVLKELEGLEWKVRVSKGHAWGTIRCPQNEDDCRCGKYCQMSIWSTPRDPQAFANHIRNKALSCVYLMEVSKND